MTFTHEQSRDVEPAAPVQSNAEVECAQTEGNAYYQQALSGAVEGAGEPAGALGPDVQEATAYLMDAVNAMWDARVDGVDDAWDMAETAASPDWTTDLLVVAIAAALSGAAASVAGGVVTAAASVLMPRSNAILEQVFNKIRDGALSQGTKGAVHAMVADQRAMQSSARDAYFVGTKAGVRAQAVDDLAWWRSVAARFSGLPDAAREIRAVATCVMQEMTRAEGIQIQQAVVEWMNVLAQVDTGRTLEDGGSDLGEAGSGRSLDDKLVGRDPRGVLHVYARFTSTSEVGSITAASIAGINKELLGVLAASGKDVLDLGIPVFVAGLVDPRFGGGSLEIGCNETGQLTIRATGGGETFLEQLALQSGTEGREGGADRILGWAAGRPIAELPVDLE